MADKDTVMETEEKEVVSRNFIEQEIDKFMTMSRPVSRRSQTVICTSDMPSPSY